MNDYYDDYQVEQLEKAAYDAAMVEAGKEWERERAEQEYQMYLRDKELDELQTRAEKKVLGERMVKLNDTIDVLIKKYSNVQFVNKKLQEKIKRQAERITQLEALYREEIKTKKQDALRERAEKAEAMVERFIDVGYSMSVAPDGACRNKTIHDYDVLVSEWRKFRVNSSG